MPHFERKLQHLVFVTILISCKPATYRVSNAASDPANNYPTQPTHMHEIEFAASADGKSLFIVADSRELLMTNCQMITQYANYLRLRNSQQPLAQNNSALCIPEPLTIAEKNSFYHPSETNFSSENFFPAFLKSATKKIDITNIFPPEIFSRSRKNVVYDGICYNSALVASGIFSFADYSRFEPPVEGLLGYIRLTTNGNQNDFSLGFRRTPWFSQTIKNEKSWHATSSNLDAVKVEISEYIRTHFSPGSVLCINSQKLMNAGEKASEIKSALATSGSLHKPAVVISDATAILGQRGDHCATFVTPHLLVESSNDGPHSFISWAKAFPYYWNWIGLGGKQISFQYSQIQPRGILDWTKNSKLFDQSSNFSSVQNALREFHNAYDSKSGVTTGELLELVESLKMKLNGQNFRDFLDTKSNLQNEDPDPETQLAFEYWSFVLETIPHLEATLRSRTPSSPWP
jgi:hypothetical protein